MKSFKFKFLKKADADIDYSSLPVHIGIIMDGNGRWAKKRGLPRSAGHAAGAKTFERIVEDAGEIGIKIVTVYAFSTENWNRPESEVSALMELLEDYLDNGLARLAGRKVKIHFLGDMSAFSNDFQKKMHHMEESTKENDGLLLNVALNYGGRMEITSAVKKITQKVVDKEMTIEDIKEETVENFLYTAGQPDPDLIIRPSGEYRLSNFLMWQSAYSEFWFSNCLWPDFKKKDLVQAIRDYQQRNRRFGGI